MSKLPCYLPDLGKHPAAAREWLSWVDVLCDDDSRIFRTVGAHALLMLSLDAIDRMFAIEEAYGGGLP